MNLHFTQATPDDAPALAALHNAANDHLTAQFGPGPWSLTAVPQNFTPELLRPRFSRTLLVHDGDALIATLRLATKKPWAMDAAYFTPATRPLYLTAMVVHPAAQQQGVGRALLAAATATARAWPADAIRLDAWDAPAGAGPFYTRCGYREVAHVTYRTAPLIYFELILDTPA